MDILISRASLGEATGHARKVNGSVDSTMGVHGSGRYGEIAYDLIGPDGPVVWLSAELRGVEPETDAVKVRFVDQDGDQWYWDDAPVPPDAPGFYAVTSSPTDWDGEYSRAYQVVNIDRWSGTQLGIIVRLEPTKLYPYPKCGDFAVLIDLPTWEGAVHQAAKAVADYTSAIESRLVVVIDPTTEDIDELSIGEPRSEFGYALTGGDGVSVDGDASAYTMTVIPSSGKVEFVPTVPQGSDLRFAVRYLPQSSVRRMDDVLIISRTPAWVLSDLVRSAGLHGETSRETVGAYDVRTRRIELRIDVRGIASRQSDALQMRAALQDAFDAGLDVTLRSGRRVRAHLAPFVEMVPGDVQRQLPEARSTVVLAMAEVVSATLIRDQRDLATDQTLIGEITMEFGDDGGFTGVVDSAGASIT